MFYAQLNSELIEWIEFTRPIITCSNKDSEVYLSCTSYKTCVLIKLGTCIGMQDLLLKFEIYWFEINMLNPKIVSTVFVKEL